MTGQTLLPHEGVSGWKALEMYTVNAAYASFEEAEKGVLAAGQLADLAILDSDPTSSPPEGIKDIKVLMTVVEGKVVWQR